MPIPKSRNARLFYRAAKERLEDAELLLSLNRTTGAVYLAGYSVECIIKSLILSAVPRSREGAILAQFRGGQAHDFRWLTRLYQQHGRIVIPQQIAWHFTNVKDWSTVIRYSPKTIEQHQAKDFLASVIQIINWADGRLSIGGCALIMARYNRSKKPDPQIQQVLDVFVEYEQKHPNALIEARRGDYEFIYLRIIDPDFEGIYRSDRQEQIWKLLSRLPDEVGSEIMSLPLVTPEEAPHYGPSIEFDDPSPPLPMPDFSDEKLDQWENGHAMNGASANGKAVLVPLEAQEVDAVKELASAQGLSDGDLLRSWVLEKLELAPAGV